MNTETLRETLRAHAAGAPPGGGLLEAVRTRSRRRRRPRQWTVAGAAAAAVALAVTVPAVLVRGGGADPAPPVLPAASDALAPPSFQLPDFPFTPSWSPAGDMSFGSDEYAEQVQYVHADSGAVILTAMVEYRDPGASLDKLEYQNESDGGTTDKQSATVQGRDAVLFTLYSPGTADEDEQLTPSNTFIVSWEHRPGLWVTVHASDTSEPPLDVADVLQYAENLTEEPLPAQAPFTFELVPVDAELVSYYSYGMTFAPRSDAADGQFDVRLTREIDVDDPMFACVGQERPSLDEPLQDEPEVSGGPCDPPREQVRVGEHDGVLAGEETLLVDLGEDVLEVTATGTLALSRDDLILVGAGIQVVDG